MSRGDRPSVDRLLERGAPPASVEEARALANIESRLFGRSPRPLTLSRYLLLDRLGTGGSGAVFRAYDPELDRKVAVKLLLTADAERAGTGRLLREAQALAKLSHRNVVAVYDVGHYDERDLGYDPGNAPPDLEVPREGVFVVMELIDGDDLRQWQDARPRSVREIVRVYAAAARGLAAVHDAGLTHRDFKTHNVKLDATGRVVVLDFGLARPSEPANRVAGPVGTLPYVSPEQHAGAPADPRSDQYAFGVALYQALVGKFPFVGSLEDVVRAKAAGEWGPIPASVPRRVRAILVRTLAPNPADRFPGMDAVQDALAGSLRIRRRWLVAAAVGGTLVVGGAAVWAGAAGDDPVCTGGDAAVAQVWNDARRSALRQRFLGTGVPYASTVWDGVERELDAYTAAWSEQHRDACQATRVRNELSEAMLDLRMACLDRHLREAGALLDTFEEADATVVEFAPAATNALGWLGTCENLDGLRARASLPGDPAARQAVSDLYARLTRAEATERAGRYPEALKLLDQIAVAADEVAYAPVHGAMWLQRGTVLERMGDFGGAEQALTEAVLAAEEGGDLEVAADAWLQLIWVVGVEQQREVDGRRWARFAEAAVRRLGADPLRRARLDHNLGGVYSLAGQRDLALEHYQRALEVQQRLLGEDDPAVAMTLNHIGNVYMARGELERAWPYCEQSLAIRRRVLGDAHPRVAPSWNNLAEIRRMQGRYEEAIAPLEQALAIDSGMGNMDEIVSLRIARTCYSRVGRIEDAQKVSDRLDLLEGRPSRNAPAGEGGHEGAPR